MARIAIFEGWSLAPILRILFFVVPVFPVNLYSSTIGNAFYFTIPELVPDFE